MEFRFYYDWLDEIRIVHLKNKEAIRYPSRESFYRYLLHPIKLARGYETNVVLQFFDYSTYGELGYEFEDFKSEISWSIALKKPTTTASNMSTSSQQFGVIQKDDQQESRYTVIDLVQNVPKYTVKGLELGKKVRSFTESSVKSVKRVDDLEKLPNDHLARSKKFGVAKSSLEVATGIVSMVTDGTQAWIAFRQGDYIQASYFTLKTTSTVVSTTPELVNIAKDAFGYSGKATKSAVLSSKKAQVGIAIAVGVVGFGYDRYEFVTTDDPIMKQVYGEKMAADVLDTRISVVAVFFPHVLAGQITWSVGVEVYSWFFGEDLAYRVCRTPGSAIAFLWEHFVGDIPAELAKEAYDDVLKSLFEVIKNLNDVHAKDKTFYLSVFVDPQK